MAGNLARLAGRVNLSMASRTLSRDLPILTSASSIAAVTKALDEEQMNCFHDPFKLAVIGDSWSDFDIGCCRHCSALL
jgi:hypothetical protein